MPLPSPDNGEPADGGGERFVPSLHHGYSLEPEHYARYGWAAPLVTGANVLDAGCGVGWGTALLAESAEHAVGVDWSPVAIAEATRDYEAADFREADMRDLPFADAEFDAVVCFEAIEHVAEYDQALDELRRVLRPGGLLLVSSPNRGVYPAGNPFHLHEFTSAELEASLAKRFANVAIHRQQTYFASLLGTDETLELDDPSVRLDAHVTKVVGRPPNSELYAVASASDGELPPAPQRLVLGGCEDTDFLRRELAAWQERAIRAEAEAVAFRGEMHAMRFKFEQQGRDPAQ